MPTVPTVWLAEHLRERGLKIVDATMFLPAAGRDARAEFTARHIPGAVFCDFADIHDETASLPHTLPSAAQFAAAMETLGVSSSDRVVVYDSSAQNFSAPRLWWMLRVFGHEQVAVLDGGLTKWVAEGHAVRVGASAPIPMPQGAFTAVLDVTQVRDLHAMRENIASRGEQVVDARSPGRFSGHEPEARAGVRSGHIPQSVNIHYATLVGADGALRGAGELHQIVSAAGLDVTRPIVASCGSGVTACAVALALNVLGTPSVAIYDGSWTEWGGAKDTPVETS